MVSNSCDRSLVGHILPVKAYETIPYQTKWDGRRMAGGLYCKRAVLMFGRIQDDAVEKRARYHKETTMGSNTVMTSIVIVCYLISAES